MVVAVVVVSLVVVVVSLVVVVVSLVVVVDLYLEHVVVHNIIFKLHESASG